MKESHELLHHYNEVIAGINNLGNPQPKERLAAFQGWQNLITEHHLHHYSVAIKYLAPQLTKSEHTNKIKNYAKLLKESIYDKTNARDQATKTTRKKRTKYET